MVQFTFSYTAGCPEDWLLLEQDHVFENMAVLAVSCLGAVVEEVPINSGGHHDRTSILRCIIYIMCEYAPKASS